MVKPLGLITKVSPELVNDPPPLLSVVLIVNPYDPAGVEFDVVTVKIIVEPLIPLGVNDGVVVATLVTASVLDVKVQVTPVGVPPAQVSSMLSINGAAVPDSVSAIV
jgi:hypothetical protein